MSNQDAARTPAILQPLNDDKEAWSAYWIHQGQPRRTEPEIDSERQKYLDERRQITPDMKVGIYPFKDIKLTRADVEWLLATHENRRGPIDWSDTSQWVRVGLDLRGADIQPNLISWTRFFPGLGNEASLHNPLVMLAAIEAVIGLFIEISFIATFTKRFFGS